MVRWLQNVAMKTKQVIKETIEYNTVFVRERTHVFRYAQAWSRRTSSKILTMVHDGGIGKYGSLPCTSTAKITTELTKQLSLRIVRKWS